MHNLSLLAVSVQRGILCIRDTARTTAFKGGEHRGTVDYFSDRSRARLGRYLRNAVCDYPIFITLTYPAGSGEDAPEAKRHLKCFLERAKRATGVYPLRGVQVGADGLAWSVVWWMEFTAAGRIHFHLVSTHRLPTEWLSRTWYEIVGTENELHLKAGTRVERLHGTREQMRAYAMKYAAKSEQKDVPDRMDSPGRFWGIWGNRGSVEASTVVPEHARAHGVVSDRINKFEETIAELLTSGDIEQQETGDESTRLYFFRHGWVHSCLAQRVDSINLAVAPTLTGYMRDLEGFGPINDRFREQPDPDEAVFAELPNSALTADAIIHYAHRLHPETE